MRGFFLGLIVGLLLGGSVAAFAAVIAGDNGYAPDWSVTKAGEEICSGPFIWVTSKEIECD